MFQHNGFYGCTYCVHPGTTIDGSHSYYPMTTSSKNVLNYQLREYELHEFYVQKAEELRRSGHKKINVVGVKGKSPFSSVIKGKCIVAHQ